MEKLCLAVLADLHVSLPGSQTLVMRGLDAAINDIHQLGCSNVLLNGDLSNNAKLFQFKSLFSYLKADKVTNYLISIGNHDTWSTNQDVNDYVKKNLFDVVGIKSETIYYEKEIAGYHFLVLNSQRKMCSEAYLGFKQLFWLDQCLRKYCSVNKPVFVCCHHPLSGELKQSMKMNIGIEDEDVKEILRRYQNIVFISGHTHNSYHHCGVIKADYGYAIDVPSFSLNGNNYFRRGTGIELSLENQRIVVSYRNFIYHYWLNKSYIIDLLDGAVVSGERRSLVDFEVNFNYEK